MGALFAGWPPEAIATAMTLLAGALAWPAKAAFQIFVTGTAHKAKTHEQGWALAKDRGEEIIALRQEIDRRTAFFRTIIDRMRRRETAYATGCELLLIAMPPEPTRAIALREEGEGAVRDGAATLGWGRGFWRMLKGRNRLAEIPADTSRDRIGAALREAYKIDDQGDAQMRRLVDQLGQIEGNGRA